MTGAKVMIFFFAIFAFFAFFFEFRVRSKDIRPFLISETGLKFPVIWTQGEIGPGDRASPATRTDVKRPLLSFKLIGLGKRTHILNRKG